MKNRNGVQMSPVAARQLQENSTWYLISGIGLVILGALAIIFSATSTMFSMMYLGFFFIVLGLFEGVQSFKLSKWSSFFLHLALGILYVLAGISIIYYPVASALNLTLFLAIFFVVSGAMRVIFALSQHVPNRTWLLINGICTVILGLIIWQQWPVSGLWAIGLLVGVDAIFTGWTWIMLSTFAKKLK